MDYSTGYFSEIGLFFKNSLLITRLKNYIGWVWPLKKIKTCQQVSIIN